jgi:replicative DNA helicase
MTTTSTRRPEFRAQRIELGKLFDKLPPQAPEAEMSLLGAMIHDGQVVGEIMQILQTSADFASQSHVAIYDALVHLYDEHQQVDIVQLNQRLKDLGLLEKLGGTEYLVELAESVPSQAGAEYWAQIVRDKAVLRRLIEVSGKVLHDAYTNAASATEQVEEAEQAIFQLAQQGGAQDATELKVLLQDLYAQLEDQEGRHITGIESGFVDLDEKTSGLQNGEMIIVAGRPSMGKTALAVNIAEHAAVNRKQPTVIFSLEMSKQQLAQRLLCSRSSVDSHRLRRNMLSADDFAELAATVGELSEAPLYVDDTPGLSITVLRAKARRMASRHDIKLVIVDYMQLMSGPGEARQQEVSNISRGIKALARELNVPVICLSQLNRAAESREGHRPRMSDLRESGSIEQDADVVMMVHREEYYHDREWAAANPDKVGVAELIITKQRNGPTGTIDLHFDARTTRFNNMTHSQPPASSY